MSVLGALIAGGTSSRFGSDKALARWEGRRLIDHALDALRDRTADLVVCGREWGNIRHVDDLPIAGLGPLGGLLAALVCANRLGHDWVLCAPVDVAPLGANLSHLLSHRASAVILEQRSVGMWSASLEAPLRDFLNSGERSIGRWVAASSALELEQLCDMRNFNSPTDMTLP